MSYKVEVVLLDEMEGVLNSQEEDFQVIEISELVRDSVGYGRERRFLVVLELDDEDHVGFEEAVVEINRGYDSMRGFRERSCTAMEKIVSLLEHLSSVSLIESLTRGDGSRHVE